MRGAVSKLLIKCNPRGSCIHSAVIPGLPVRAEPGIQKVFDNRFRSLDSGFRYAAPE
jgi:hypothetical protein